MSSADENPTGIVTDGASTAPVEPTVPKERASANSTATPIPPGTAPHKAMEDFKHISDTNVHVYYYLGPRPPVPAAGLAPATIPSIDALRKETAAHERVAVIKTIETAMLAGKWSVDVDHLNWELRDEFIAGGYRVHGHNCSYLGYTISWMPPMPKETTTTSSSSTTKPKKQEQANPTSKASYNSANEQGEPTSNASYGPAQVLD